MTKDCGEHGSFKIVFEDGLWKLLLFYHGVPQNVFEDHSLESFLIKIASSKKLTY